MNGSFALLWAVAISLFFSPALAQAQDPPSQQAEDNQSSDDNVDEKEDGDPVQLGTGNLTFDETDLEIPGRGMNLEIKRTYRSGTAVTTALGPKWDLNWFKRIVVEYAPFSSDPPQQCFGPGALVSGVYYYDGATRIDFTPPNGNFFDMPNGYFAKLKAIQDSPDGHFVPIRFEMRFQDGMLYVFETNDTTSPYMGGCSQTFYLNSVTDAQGNQILLEYEDVGYQRLSKMFDVFGRQVDFFYDSNDQLQAIQDFDSRRVEYSYDAGRLHEVRSPVVVGTSTANDFPQGKTRRYGYGDAADPALAEKILTITQPNEVAAGGSSSLVNTYDAAGDRVVAQIVGGTNASGVAAGGRYVFLYENHGSAINWGWFQETGRTLVISPNGNVSLTIFDKDGRDFLSYQFTGRLDPQDSAFDDPTSVSISSLVATSVDTEVNAKDEGANFLRSTAPSYVAPLRIDDPGSYFTKKVTNSHGLVTELETSGKRTVSVYDELSPDRFQQGNLLRQEEHPVPDDGSAPLIRTWAYEPVYNAVRVKVDPRGNDPSYLPPNGGTTSPARYATVSTFDYQENDIQDIFNPVNQIAGEWDIDMLQASMFAAVPGIASFVNEIESSDKLWEVNGDGSIFQYAGRVIRTTLPTAQYVEPQTASWVTPVLAPQTAETFAQFNDFGSVMSLVNAEGEETLFYYFDELDPTGQQGAPSANGGGLLAKREFDDGTSETFSYNLVGHSTGGTDERGNPTVHERNALGQLVSTTLPDLTVSSLLYDANDNVVETRITNSSPEIDPQTAWPTGISVTDPVSPVLSTYLTYDIMDVLIEEDRPGDASGRRVTRYRNDREDNRVLVLHPEWGTGSGEDANDVTSMVYDERGLVYSETRGGLAPEFLGLSAHSQISEAASIPPLTSPLQESTERFQYDGHGNLAKRIDGEGEEWTRFYDRWNRLNYRLDPLGNLEELVWDVAGNLVASRTYDGQTGTLKLLSERIGRFDERRREYEVHHLLVADDAALGVSDGPLTPNDDYATERSVFDREGRTIVRARDNRDFEGRAYDSRGRLIRSWDSSGFHLDAGGVWITPVGSERTWIYDPAGNVLQESLTEFREDGTSEAFHTWHCYDSRNRRTATIRNDGSTERSLYDSRSNLVFVSDGNSADIAFAHLLGLDSLSDHQTLSNPPPLFPINNHGNTRTMEYDDAGRRVKLQRHQRVGGVGSGAIDPTQAGDGVVTMETGYDKNDRVIARRDDAGFETEYQFDPLGRLTATLDENGVAHAIVSYDRRDLVQQVTDQNGSVITSGYDAKGRLTSRSIQKAPGVLGAANEAFQYDGMDRMVSATDEDASVTIEYDSLSRRVRETQNGQVVVSLFDGVGNMTELSYPGGRHLLRSHDGLNRLESMTDVGLGMQMESREYIGSRLERQERAFFGSTPTVANTVQYDARRRIAATQGVKLATGASIDHRTYTWDRAGNKLSRTDVDTGVTHDYRYDSLSQLVESERQGSVGQDRTITYTLDGVGNRTDVAGGPEPGLYTQLGLDAGVHQYTATPPDRRFYDDAGNLTRQRVILSVSGGFPPQYEFEDRLIAYDYRNRMVRHENVATGVVTIYGYDPLGRRISKGVGGVETVYLYRDFECIEEQDDQAATLATFVHGVGADDLVAMCIGPVHYLYHNDDLGNVMKLTNVFGNVAERYDYEDYGQPLNPNTWAPLSGGSSIGNPYLFSGRRFDAESGWFYFRHRYLDPQAGRFTTRDPLGIWEDAVNLGNGYTYVGNNPWSRRDRSGLKTEETPEERKERLINEEKARQEEIEQLLKEGKISEAEYQLLMEDSNKRMEALEDLSTTDAEASEMMDLIELDAQPMDDFLGSIDEQGASDSEGASEGESAESSGESDEGNGRWRVSTKEVTYMNDETGNRASLKGKVKSPVHVGHDEKYGFYVEANLEFKAWGAEASFEVRYHLPFTLHLNPDFSQSKWHGQETYWMGGRY